MGQYQIDFFIRKGLSAANLRHFVPVRLTKEQRAAITKTPADTWECRPIPAKIFSSEVTEEVRQRRIFATFLVSNYKTLKKSSQVIAGLKQEKSKNAAQLGLETLTTYYNAHMLTLENSSCLEENAALSFNASVNLLKAFDEDLILLENCPCGKPLLVRVQDIYTTRMYFKRDFFRCPWCNSKETSLLVYLERKLYESEQWAKLQQRTRRPKTFLKNKDL